MGIVARRQFDRRVFCLALGALTLSGTALAQSRFRKRLDGTWGGAQGRCDRAGHRVGQRGHRLLLAQ